MQYVLNATATAVIIAYNHPSGNLNPSLADIEITRSSKAAMELFTIWMLDHLIITSDEEYKSIMDFI